MRIKFSKERYQDRGKWFSALNNKLCVFGEEDPVFGCAENSRSTWFEMALWMTPSVMYVAPFGHWVKHFGLGQQNKPIVLYNDPALVSDKNHFRLRSHILPLGDGESLEWGYESVFRVYVVFAPLLFGISKPTYPSFNREASALLDPMECTDMAEEQRVHSPPASLVPRIHVILAQKLQHINPLLPTCLNKEESRTCKGKCWSPWMAVSPPWEP